MKKNELLNLIQNYSYLGIFLWFSVLQMIFPIPEEIALISIGYLSTHIKINILLAMLTGAIGLVLSDSIFYFMAKSGSTITKKIIDKFNSKWKDKIKKIEQSKSVNTIFLLFFIPKIRILAPLISGYTGMSAKKYFLVNFLANLLIASFYMVFGVFFYHSLDVIRHDLHEMHHLLFILAMITISAIIIFIYYKRTHSVRKEKAL